MARTRSSSYEVIVLLLLAAALGLVAWQLLGLLARALVWTLVAACWLVEACFHRLNARRDRERAIIRRRLQFEAPSVKNCHPSHASASQVIVSAPAVDPEDVKLLMRKLGGRDRRTRELAEELLRRAGPPVLLSRRLPSGR